jgi:hypothetical protein
MNASDTAATIARTAAIEGIQGYRVQSFIDRGGMGDVYLALDENLQRRVAIKIIHPEFSTDPEYKKRFTREAHTVAAFQHKNIVTVYASGWLGDKQYLVMEYVGGGTLEERMSASPLSPAAASDIACQMADALAYAHKRDVIHRDFKPRNILMREDGTPVLSDFGVAKTEVTYAEKTAIGVVIGNPKYMAPEQARGEKISDRIDVYSFGLVFHEMLAGRLPGSYPVKTKNDESALAKSAGKEFAELIGRCLQADPAARPSAAECRDWITERARAGTGRGRARPLVLVALGALLLAAAGLIALRSGVLGRPPYGPASAAQKPAPTSTIPLSVKRQPTDAKIFIDGEPLERNSVDLPRGAHELVAVAPRYYGESRRLDLAPGRSPGAVAVALDATRLPDLEEEERFLRLADAPVLTEADVSSITERTLNTALRAKLLRLSGQTAEFDALKRQISTLDRFGDARAAVASLLIDSVQSGHFSGAQVTQSLIAASNGGDAMASLFVAVAYRESLLTLGRRPSPNDAGFRRYCERMGMATAQGWAEVAGEYFRRDCSN